MPVRSFSGLGAVKVTGEVALLLLLFDNVVVVVVVVAVTVDDGGGGGFGGRRGARGAVSGTGTLMMGARGR